MSERYTIDPGPSRFTVHGAATGLLSVFAHSPTFAVRSFAGSVVFTTDEVQSLALDLTVQADSLSLLDHVKPSDRQEIEARMRGEVLNTVRFAEIRYQASVVSSQRASPGRYHIGLGGQLALHGQTRPYHIDAELHLYEDGLKLRGEGPLRYTDFRIAPVAALGGAIRLKDDLTVSFDLVGLPENR